MHHISYVVSGRFHVRMDDGRELELGPGDAHVVGPGHDAWVVGEEPCVTVDFIPAGTGSPRAIERGAGMGSWTVKHVDEMEAIFHGSFKRAAAELSVESFGMQVFDMPPNFSDYPEHDHAEDGQEEVYVVLRGEVELEVEGQRVSLTPEHMARVGPGTGRKLYTGPGGARILVIGATPGRLYSRPEPFQLGAPDPTAARTS